MLIEDVRQAKWIFNETNECEKQDAMIYLFGLLSSNVQQLGCEYSSSESLLFTIYEYSQYLHLSPLEVVTFVSVYFMGENTLRMCPE